MIKELNMFLCYACYSVHMYQKTFRHKTKINKGENNCKFLQFLNIQILSSLMSWIFAFFSFCSFLLHLLSCLLNSYTLSSK